MCRQSKKINIVLNYSKKSDIGIIMCLGSGLLLPPTMALNEVSGITLNDMLYMRKKLSKQ